MEPDRLTILKEAEKEVRGLAVDINRIPEHGFPLAGLILKTREEIERLGRVLPLSALKELAGLYVQLNRYAASLISAAPNGELAEILRPVLRDR